MSDSSPAATAEAPASPSKPAPIRKTRVGLVVSDKMTKTIVVQVTTRKPHPRFGKIVKHRKKFYAHDDQEQASEGDTVRIGETRPLSKLKCWELLEVLKH